MKHGLSLRDIEELYEDDIRTITSLVECVRRMERIELLKTKLSMAEAFNFAFVGSQHDTTKKNQSAYARWQYKMEVEINKLQGAVQETIWDRLKKSRRL